MKNKTSFIVVLFFVLSSCVTTTQMNAMKENEALFSRIFKDNLKFNTSDMDQSPFKASEILHGESIVYSQEGLKERDIIKSLPGQPPVPFNQYSGYVVVNQTTDLSLFYYLVEARHSASTLPLLLWLNEGTGCSSLGYGAIEDIGPFRVHSDGKTLYINDYAWNNVANVLFWESTAGNGFSRSKDIKDYVVGSDAKATAENYVFLANWIERFPEYKNRELYIGGMKYAGHFASELAQTILYHNQKAGEGGLINLKGVVIGNGLIDDESDFQGYYKYLASHVLISNDIPNQIFKNCGNSGKNGHVSNKCQNIIDKVDDEVADINLNNIYAPLCSNSKLTDKPHKKSSLLEFDPCSEKYIEAYLNRLDVQKAFHVMNVDKVPNDWSFCSINIKQWTSTPLSVIPLLKEIMAKGIRLWIYSADLSGWRSVTSTQLGIEKMKLRKKTSGHAWYALGEVAGYTELYENLTFATIRGSGLPVAGYQPVRALSLVTQFLAGKELPNSSS